MPEHADAAPGLSRRSFLGLALSTGLASAARWSSSAWSDVPRRWRIGFANITEDPAERLEGLGFTGREVRESFVYAERGLPVEMVAVTAWVARLTTETPPGAPPLAT